MAYYPNSSETTTVVIQDITYKEDGTIYRDNSTSKSYYRRYAPWQPSVQHPKMTNGWRYPSSRTRSYYYADEPSGSYEISVSTPPKGKRVRSAAPQGADAFSRRLSILTGPQAVLVPLNMRSRVDTELRNKLSQGNLNLGVAIAESRQTLSLLSQNAITFIRAYSQARRGNWRQVCKLLAVNNHKFTSKTVSSRWLELQFGWLPLLADIHAAYKILTETQLPKRLPLRVVRMVGSTESSVSYIGTTPALRTGEWKVTERYSRKAVCWYYINDSRLAWASSLGLLNPQLIMWEKVPFSFVVDWFIPVGNLIESATNTLGLSFISGTYTDLCDATGTLQLYSSVGKPETAYSTQTFSGRGYTRTTLSSFPLPKPYYKSPLSTIHALDALALIKQRFK